MAVINILDPHVADMIAAGEVVERPASVIKELMENAFDAGAKNITVELRGGGATYIRVTDDGCGMAPEDAGVAFLRHATSKLHDEKGLEAIQTMGFRGEALAAISAVSHVELRTRRRGDAGGTLVTLTAGEIQEMEPAGCPEGTTMIVKDLFFNTDRAALCARQTGGLCAAAARREGGVLLPRRRATGFLCLYPAGSGARLDAAPLQNRRRRAARLRLRVLPLGRARQPQRPVFLLQRAHDPLPAPAGRA